MSITGFYITWEYSEFLFCIVGTWGGSCENSSSCILWFLHFPECMSYFNFKMILLKNVVVDCIFICVFNQDALICEFRNMQSIITLVTWGELRTLVPSVILVLWKLWKKVNNLYSSNAHFFLKSPCSKKYDVSPPKTY